MQRCIALALVLAFVAGNATARQLPLRTLLQSVEDNAILPELRNVRCSLSETPLGDNCTTSGTPRALAVGVERGCFLATAHDFHSVSFVIAT
jgi:hypothetical protein